MSNPTEENSHIEEDGDLDQTYGRSRRKFVEEADLNPGTLIGSFFHEMENEDPVAWGIIVAEPAPQCYLAEYQGEPGAKRLQRLVTLPSLIENSWRFFDTEEAMNEAWAEWQAREAA